MVPSCPWPPCSERLDDASAANTLPADAVLP